ncbi:uncharacterized protein LOC144435147 [Glandiceps talaboti]
MSFRQRRCRRYEDQASAQDSSTSSSQSSSRASSTDRCSKNDRKCGAAHARRAEKGNRKILRELEWANIWTRTGCITGESALVCTDSYLAKCLEQLDQNIRKRKKRRKRYLNTLSYATGYFAGGVFDHRGGELVLADGDVRLRITPNAVSKSLGPYKVYIYLTHNMKEYPKTSGVDGMYLSPVIRCGPHGLAFEKPVLLSVKTAIEEGEYSSFKVFKSDTKPNEECSWQVTDDDEAHCIWSRGPDRGYCITALKHFTLYRIIGMRGESILKGVFKVQVFMEFGKRHSIKLRVRVFPDTVADLKIVKQSESEIGGTLVDVDTSQRISIEENKGLVMNLTDVSPDGWKLVNDTRCEVKPEHIWMGQSRQPSGVVRTFSLESVGGLPDNIGCRLAVCEQGRPDTEIIIKLRSTLYRQQPRDALYQLQSTARRPANADRPIAQVNAVDRDFRNSLPEFQRVYNDRFSDIINYELYVDLCVRLDIESQCDARFLAANLGLKTETISYLTKNVTGQHRSLSSCLLDFYIERSIQGGLNKREILTDLEGRLKNIGHEQAAILVHDHLCPKKASVRSDGSSDSGMGGSSFDEGEST